MHLPVNNQPDDGRSTLRSVRNVGVVAILSLVVAACAPAEENLAIVANSPGTLQVGEQRVLVGYLSEEGQFLADPDLPAQADFFFGDETEPRVTAAGIYQPTVPGLRGIYRFAVSFPEAGPWRVVLRPNERPPTPETAFQVFVDAVTPGPGDPAPRSESVTSADRPLEEITTDPSPDPEFYEQSIAEAVTSGQASVIVFATPAFCTTATCGPTLDIVKSLAGQYRAVNFLHVEVFENLDAASFEDLVVVPAVAEWSLPSEPWVFVVDSNGLIAAAFEGTVADEELVTALELVSG